MKWAKAIFFMALRVSAVVRRACVGCEGVLEYTEAVRLLQATELRILGSGPKPRLLGLTFLTWQNFGFRV